MDNIKSIFKELLRRHKTLNRFFLLSLRKYRAVNGGYPRWPVLLGADQPKWRDALARSREGQKVLVATSVGGHLAANLLEGLLGVALTLRGAEVHVLLCDAALPACLDCEINWYPNQEKFAEYGPARDLCKDCFWPAHKMCRSLGLRVHRYSELLNREDQEAASRLAAALPLREIPDYQLDGLAVGEHALAGALRFFARGSLEEEPCGESVLRRYFQAALITTSVTKRLLQNIPFSCAVFHHGIYVPQGLIGEVAREAKVRVVNWNPAYRKKCFIFSHLDTYHHTLMTEPVANWEDMPWTPDMEEELLAYLKSRWQGTEDWIWFHEKPKFDLSAITQELGVDFSRPCIGLLTNVVWDAQLHYPANAFSSLLDWLHQTIAYFARRPDLQLLIRVHPAEIRGTLPSRQPVVEEINQAFPVLPPNIFVIPPESQVSTYAAMLQCNAVIIYGTKTGVELTSMGIPVIVAGEAWIRNKGITRDAASAEEYFRFLDQLPLKEPLDAETVRRARKYAYHFFFRRMIPLEFMEPTKANPPYRLNLQGLRELQPGQSLGLDVICQGILRGEEFIYPVKTT